MSASVKQSLSKDEGSSSLPASVRASALWPLSQLEVLLRKEVNATIDRAQISGLSLRGYWALEAIAASDRLTQSELSELLSIDRSDMVRLMDTLQDAGLAERTRDEADRRRQLISLTAKGNKVRTSLRRAIRRAERSAIAACPDEILGNLAEWFSSESGESDTNGAAPQVAEVDFAQADATAESASNTAKTAKSDVVKPAEPADKQKSKKKKKRNKKKMKPRGSK